MMIGMTPGVPVFLASVTSPEEALLAAAGGAQIIDCKDPKNGALGALAPAIIKATVSAIAGRRPVSATVGDLPADAEILVNAVRATAATGVDLVKVGFFGDGAAQSAIAAIGRVDIGRAQRVAVLMADRQPDFSIIADLAAAGFAGVMLDTADKSAGALPDVLDGQALQQFIATARRFGLACGLAGSLRAAHIASIVALQPDVIGFRGALCDGGRVAALDGARVRDVRREIDAATAILQPSKRSVA